MTEVHDLSPEQLTGKAEPISQGAVALFLKERGGIRPCEACGSSAWRAHREEADQASGAIAFAKLGNTASQAAVPAVFVYCMTCGLVRTFLRSFVAEWVRERRHG
jgi:hypothetical protein